MRMFAVLALAAGSLMAQVTTPAAFFGFPLGADRKLADWTQLTAYYQTLARESPRIRYQDLGPTTEGRPFGLVTITSAANMRELAHYQQINARLADPRTTPPAVAQRLIAEGKSILTITVNIHSTEIASSQTAAQFAYEMASGSSPEIRQILDQDIILLVPSLNPDGEQLVVDWYKKYLGTRYEGISPVVLYQKYVGHDDNRDWYMFTQKETRLTVEKVLNPWHPQILYDVHQMGATGTRLFLPPWVDPIDPNVDPIIVASMNAVGMDTARDLIAQGKTGVLVDGVYDGFSPARQYIVYHGGLRLLTESASARIASPVDIPFNRLSTGINYDAKVAKWNFPNPWPGGHWTLADIVNYQLSAFYSIAHNMAVNRESFLRNFYTVGMHAVTRADHPSWPADYVVAAHQANPIATATLINTLREGGVEVHRRADDSYVIPLDQPYGAFAKTLLERQHYPNIRQYPGGPPQRPYDVTAQTLPLLLGVDVSAVQVPIADPGALVTAPVAMPALPNTEVITGNNNAALLALFSRLRRGLPVRRSTDGPLLRLPRIGLYQSWTAPIDEGWTRWIFDQDGIPYTRIQDADLRAGNLRARFDAILIPDQSAQSLVKGLPATRVPAKYAGGVGASGMENLKAFVSSGGTLVALNQSSLAFLDWTNGQVRDALAGVGNTDFYSPGSILAAEEDGKPVAIFSEQSPAFAVSGAAKSLVTYGQGDPLLSGWLLGGERLAGRSALVTMPLGRGWLVLFGFKPQYRAQSQATYPMLFDALLGATGSN